MGFWQEMTGSGARIRRFELKEGGCVDETQGEILALTGKKFVKGDLV